LLWRATHDAVVVATVAATDRASIGAIAAAVAAEAVERRQESRAVERKPRDAAAVLFDLKFADNIHYQFKSS